MRGTGSKADYNLAPSSRPPSPLLPAQRPAPSGPLAFPPLSHFSPRPNLAPIPRSFPLVPRLASPSFQAPLPALAFLSGLPPPLLPNLSPLSSLHPTPFLPLPLPQALAPLVPPHPVAPRLCPRPLCAGPWVGAAPHVWTAALQPPLTAAARRPAPRPAPRLASKPPRRALAGRIFPRVQPPALPLTGGSPGPAHLSPAPQPPQARRSPAGLRASGEQSLLFWGLLLICWPASFWLLLQLARICAGSARESAEPLRAGPFFFLLRSAFFVTLRRGCSGYFCNFPPPPAGGPGVARGRGPGDATWTARGCRPHRSCASPPAALELAPHRQRRGRRSARGSR